MIFMINSVIAEEMLCCYCD